MQMAFNPQRAIADDTQCAEYAPAEQISGVMRAQLRRILRQQFSIQPNLHNVVQVWLFKCGIESTFRGLK
jgi:hypothetical protein